MIVLQDKKISSTTSCPYLKEHVFCQEYFFAHDLTSREFQNLLDMGWRRFGLFFFRPLCIEGTKNVEISVNVKDLPCWNCGKCRPLRVPVKHHVPSKSQRRNLRRNQDIEIRLSPNHYREELYHLYMAHQQKFLKADEPQSEEHFRRAHFQPAVPCFQAEYFFDDRLVGLGFLDQGELGLSTVYFCYDPEFSQRGLGTFSVLKEIELTRELGFDYYYLGYYIKDCQQMNYKGRFKPFELMDWKDLKWNLQVPEKPGTLI
jgi:arginyl-tRNA--protein-N-Asp/Glu arginylyltransferase